MKCDIYKSSSMKNAYLFVPAGTDPEQGTLGNVKKRYGKFVFSTTIEIEQDSPPFVFDPKEVIEDVDEQGFHIQNPDGTQNVSEFGAAIGGGILAASLGLGPVGAIAGTLLGALLAMSAKKNKSAADA